MTLAEHNRKMMKEKHGIDIQASQKAINLDEYHKAVTPCSYTLSREKFLREKYKIPKGLSLEGMTTKEEPTLSDMTHQANVANMQGRKLQVAQATMKSGSKMNVWYTVTK